MRTSTLFAASGLLAAVNAAPRAVPFGDKVERHVVDLDLESDGMDVNVNLADLVKRGWQQPAADQCPPDVTVVSTTTVDVTVYVTPGATEPCPEEIPTKVVTIDSTTTECPESEMPQEPETVTFIGTKGTKIVTVTQASNNHGQVNSTEPCDDETAVPTPHISTHVYNITNTTPCPEDEMTTTPTPWTNGTSTEPCDEETATPHMSTQVYNITQTTPCPEDEMTTTPTPWTNGTSTEPCDETTVPTPHVSTNMYNMTLTTPCPEDEMTTTPVPETTEPCPEDEMTTTPTPWTNGTSTEPCPEDEMTTTTIPTETTEPCPEDMTTSSQHMNTTATEPCPEDEVTTTPMPADNTTSLPPCPEDETTSSPTPTPTPWSNSTTTCVIDTAMTPVSTSTIKASPVHTAVATTTLCVHDEPTGTPSSGTDYCGIHAKPVGTYFIAEFIEEKPGTPVTEEGCYQFCDSVMESTKGCKSYRFYHNQLGAPRCALYGMPVSYVVDDLDKNQPDTWYDLTCGSPKQQKWHDSKKMPASHARRSVFKWF